ncbi:acyl carrier protein [Paenibacillus oenotherae]|uniref:Acyl carrier protein n=1 Tax=Paenibacillus oenotherae TaxID=1435645 RepID=A0ABS7DAI3_9BACL|nr:acyl carrier protein [Paenibacillus oenotherae]MBW7476947.1 acyl carrier protein [Paenibacillus oenotherae]
MTEQQVKEELKGIIAAIIEIDEFNDSDEFVNDLGIDSMLSLEMVVRIEKAFKISIPEEYLTEFVTLNDVARVVNQILGTEKASV